MMTKSPNPTPVRNVYVASLPTAFSPQQLRALCEPFGAVLDVKVFNNKRGGGAANDGRAYAFVEFAALDGAARAVAQLPTAAVQGQRVQARYATVTPLSQNAANNHRRTMVPPNPPQLAAVHQPPPAQLPHYTGALAPNGYDYGGYDYASGYGRAVAVPFPHCAVAGSLPLSAASTPYASPSPVPYDGAPAATLPLSGPASELSSTAPSPALPLSPPMPSTMVYGAMPPFLSMPPPPLMALPLSYPLPPPPPLAPPMTPFPHAHSMYVPAPPSPYLA
jgi:hypothetical protein